MFKERSTEIGSVTDTASGFASLATHRSEVFTDKLRQVCPGQVTPEVFDRIEFWSIGRQEFCREPVGLPSNPSLNTTSTMRGEAVPDQDHLPPANMAFECLEIAQDLWLFHCSRLQSQAQADTPCAGTGDQAGDGRQAFPVEGGYQNGSLPARGPGAADAGPFRKTTFIQENQQGPGAASLFLIRGQRDRTQCRITSSLRSRAFCSGRWQLHPS